MATRLAQGGWFAVATVALGTFTLVTNEFLPVGLLTPMRLDLGVSEGIAGLSMTAPAIVAALASPILTVASGRIDRRKVLLVMSVLLTGSDALSALAPNFGVLLLARLLLGLALGGFWAIGASVGGRLVGPASAAKASAIIFGGISLGMVLGVPIGTLVGGLFGWRAAFATTAGLAFVLLILQAIALPRITVATAVTFRLLARVARGRHARTGLLGTALIILGQTAAYTFVAPYLEAKTGASAATVSILLLVYGAAGLAGNLVVARFISSGLKRVLIIVTGSLAASIILMPILGHATIPVVILLATWGFAFGAVPIATQTWIYSDANSDREGGSALFITAYQSSMAIGSAVGAVIVNTLNVTASMLIGGIIVALALALVIFIERWKAQPAGIVPAERVLENA